MIRKDCYTKAGYRCEICGGKGDKWPVECHEVWHYDDKNNIQTLKRLIALCPMCHKSKHIGLAEINGELDIVREHLMKVNDITIDEANRYISDVFTKWRERSAKKWDIDINYLTSIMPVSYTHLRAHET